MNVTILIHKNIKEDPRVVGVFNTEHKVKIHEAVKEFMGQVAQKLKETDPETAFDILNESEAGDPYGAIDAWTDAQMDEDLLIIEKDIE